jgi:hypothetical protein
MSDDFDHSSEPRFSSFIPLTIALSAFIVWFLFQDYELNAQRSALNQNIAKAQPTVAEAIQVSQRYVALMKDLVKTAQTDPAADAIVKDAIKAGLIRVQPNQGAGGTANGTDTSTPAPAATGT